MFRPLPFNQVLLIRKKWNGGCVKYFRFYGNQKYNSKETSGKGLGRIRTFLEQVDFIGHVHEASSK